MHCHVTDNLLRLELGLELERVINHQKETTINTKDLFSVYISFREGIMTIRAFLALAAYIHSSY